MPESPGQRPAARSRPRPATPRDPADARNARILLILGIVVALSAVVAGVVIFTGGDGTTTAVPSTRPAASVDGPALVVGKNAAAKYQVVVYEDFACPACRDFETSSRDFLRAAAARGVVRVEYRPFHLLPAPYSTQALSAWGAVLQHGTAAQALALHDVLFDRQPAASGTQPTAGALVSWAKKAGVTDPTALDAFATVDDTFIDSADAGAARAGVSGTPHVLVNGQVLPGSTAIELADRLQTMVTGG